MYNAGRAIIEGEPLYKRALRFAKRPSAQTIQISRKASTIWPSCTTNKENIQRRNRCIKRSLAIREKTLPPKHPTIANTLNNLAISPSATPATRSSTCRIPSCYRHLSLPDHQGTFLQRPEQRSLETTDGDSAIHLFALAAQSAPRDARPHRRRKFPGRPADASHRHRRCRGQDVRPLRQG